ncbi:MAG: hypothetical protein K6E91_12950 [Butyrivibrio sp.]|nr:hypothetical protein [Butyrivibrio sp.]
MLALQAKVKDPNSPAASKDFNLLYGNGGTSFGSVRLTYQQGGKSVSSIANLESDFKVSGYSNQGGVATRTLTYDKDGIKFDVIQKAKPNAEQKKYELSYTVENKCDTPLDMEYMFHVDTAYNNNDVCESYYTNQSRIDTARVYKDSSYMPDLSGSGVYSTIPNSFSIVNKDAALAFSEKIEFSGTKPDMLSVGIYYDICNWGYYDNTSNLGNTTTSQDLGFSAVWQKKGVTKGGKLEFSFDYGIEDVQKDSDLKKDEIKKANGQAVINTDAKKFWIQASSEVNDGMYISFGMIDLDTMNLRNLDVTTSDKARTSLVKLKNSQKHVSELRSHIGAQQNRLEHAGKNQANNLENTQAAESRIRDTDMAAEMVKYSNNNILMQAGQSILAQANQTNQGVMALLQ